jgi:hypothetical protein
MNGKQPTASSKWRMAIRDQGLRRVSNLFVTAPAPIRGAGIFLLLLLPMLACGYINPVYEDNNEVRLAVYTYEQEVRGKTDDLVIDFQRSEPRVLFPGQNENGGRTVWLYRLGAREFFALRPPEKTYLYIQSIDYNKDQTIATVTHFRGDGSSFQGRQLTLEKNVDGWTVTQDIEIDAAESP